MPISVQCSGCGGKFRARDELAGRRVKCPKCSAPIEVPGGQQQQAAIVAEGAERPKVTERPPGDSPDSSLPRAAVQIHGRGKARLFWAVGAGGSIVALAAVILLLILLLQKKEQPARAKRKLPDPPQELGFPAEAIEMAPGDRWDYIILSGDNSLDGKILKFTFVKREKENFHLSAQLENDPPRQFLVKAEGTVAILPREVSAGVFEAVGVSSLPESIQRDYTWRMQQLKYRYDLDGTQHAHGERTIATGPCVCWVPAGQFVCAKFSHEMIEDDQAILDGEYWLNPCVGST